MRFSLVCLLAVLGCARASSTLLPDPPKACHACEEWNGPREPFRIFGNTYYVGVAGLSAVLITSEDGHVLLDGGLPQSAPLIAANIRSLGFRTEDVRLIGVSHEHYDHVGGVGALQRLSGATVVASAPAARALAQGAPLETDPQFAFGLEENAFPAVAGVRAVADGEQLRVGPITLTAHLTPGHTPGATSWTWSTCEGSRCLNVAYVDSLNPVSAPSFRFTDHPELVSAFRGSLARVESLACDIVLTVHPSMVDLDGKARRLAEQPASNPFIGSTGCRDFAAGVAARLEARLAREIESQRADAQPAPGVELPAEGQ